MRKVKIDKWKAKVPQYEDGKVVGSIEQDETLLTALNILLSNKKPEEIPRGLEKFRLFHRLVGAFDKADKEGVLTLEEADYSFLKGMLEKDVPSVWGFNDNLNKAIEAFLEAKEE